MKITCGEQSIELRDWAEGKALLLTRDENVKEALLMVMEDDPDAAEPLTDDPDPEDFEDVFAAVVNRQRVVIVFDLKKNRIGFAVYS